MTPVMALDIGQKKTGVALTDSLEMIARPCTVLYHKEPYQLLEQVIILIREKKVDTIVVGVPYGNEGELTEQADFVLQMSRFLQKRMSKDIQWVFQEEILSTHEAWQRLLESGAGRKKRRQPMDKFAAVQILQRYLSKREVK